MKFGGNCKKELHFKSLQKLISYCLKPEMLCTIKEINGDLFSADDSYSMAHCVAADMKMGKGIAVKFR